MTAALAKPVTAFSPSKASHSSSLIDIQAVDNRRMHHALQISEIMDLIVGELALPSPCIQGKALAALATTCTIFHDIALDALWRHQRNILNLIRCMPADLWETVEEIRYRSTNRTLRRRRGVVASDWDRVSKYAHRIKSLVCFDSGDGKPHLFDVYQTLWQDFPGDYLLPNLESLTWQHWKPSYSSFIELFLGPRITSIYVGAQDDDRCPALAAVGQRYPDLVSATFLGLSVRSSASELQRLSTFIRALTRVESLKVEMIDSEALRHLGQLTTLKMLHTTFPDWIAPPAMERSMFPALRDTHLSIDGDLSPFIAFMRTWNNPQIQSFSTVVDYPRDLQHVADLYQVLATSCVQRHLETLKVYFDGHDRSFVPHPGHFFAHLLAFTYLRIVEIRVPGGYNLDDATISDMARAWPYIQKLELAESSRRHDDPPGCTMLGLRFLAQQCSHLHSLRITLDASRIPPAAIDPAERVVQDELVYLDTTLSPISDPWSVARFISAIFPNATRLASSWDSNWDSTVRDQHRQRWDTVRRTLERRRRR
ncbi:Carboxylic ester hydrolase [Mycena venus]|uniref:Carboxylic ester hydrolase n=1 Tax=Mycena venus TaxID=2733690 RepID=A0A8H6YZD7_9AGAR|nr:Carboxylic ester hydrolase [Mycena venus]